MPFLKEFAMMILLAEEGPGFFRVLAPVLTLVALAVFGWLSEKAKKKEQQRQAEEDARREGEAATSQVRPRQTARPLQQRPVRARPAEPVRRYQPEIPPGPERQREWLEPEAEEAELIIVAEDVSAELARRRAHEQRQRQIRDQTVRAKALQAQRRQRAALQAKLAAEKAAKQKRSRALHDGKVLAKEAEILQPVSPAVPLVGKASAVQLGQAIVWAEILGPPLALRPQQQRF